MKRALLAAAFLALVAFSLPALALDHAHQPWDALLKKHVRYVATAGSIAPNFESIPYTKLTKPYWPKVANPFA